MVTTTLRERMRSILRTRNYSPRTEETYIAAVARFARHFGKPPDQLGPAQVIEYQIWLREHKHASATLANQAVCALRFLYREVLGRPDEVERIPYARRERRLPVVLSPEETARFLVSIPIARYRVLLTTIYATGLRISEALALRAGCSPKDSSSKRARSSASSMRHDPHIRPAANYRMHRTWHRSPPFSGAILLGVRCHAGDARSVRRLGQRNFHCTWARKHSAVCCCPSSATCFPLLIHVWTFGEPSISKTRSAACGTRA